ncbi:Beta-adaptin-like protein B [Capsicum baccatum]|uniref:Beta-adaptin-like protein B n=1 Tax=Capsicum baccatum TaxID=33114 RepID=A0A2G2VN57_CAPBA|nr:Beta-adaptin-like protein B [Capsicum baccatum]
MGPGKSSLPNDLQSPYNDHYAPAPKFCTNNSTTIPLNGDLPKVGSMELNSSIPTLSHLKDLKINNSPLFLNNTMGPLDSQLKVGRPQIDFMHDNKNSQHVHSPVNYSDVHPYNDYSPRDDNDLLNSQKSLSPSHFAKSHVFDLTLSSAINHGSFSNLPIQGSTYPSQPIIPDSTTIPQIYSDGTKEQSSSLPNLHIKESYSSLSTPVMDGGSTHGTCTHIYHNSEWSRVSGRSKSPKYVIPMYVKWKPPAPSSTMLNTDATCNPGAHHATIAGVFRNCNGTWILGFTNQFPTLDPLEAELHALLLGLAISLEHRFVAIFVAKIYDINVELVEDSDFRDALKELISDNNHMVVANAITALAEIQESSSRPIFEITSHTLSKLLTALNKCTEWSQVFILDALSKYEAFDARKAENIVERVTSRLQL